MDKSQKKYIASFAVMILLIVFTFYILLKDGAAMKLADALRHVNIYIIALGLLIMLLFIMCEAYNIKIILRTMNIKAKYMQCLKFAFVGFYFSAITPSAAGGQPMQMYYMDKDKIGIAHSSMTFLVIAFAFQSVSLLYFITMLIAKHNLVIAHTHNMKWLMLYGIIINIFLISVILFAIFSHKTVKKISYFILKLLHKLHIVKDIDKAGISIDKQIEEYKSGAQFIKNNKKLFIYVFIVTAIQITCQYSISFVVYKAFNLSGYSLFDMLAMQSVLTISTSSLPLPGAVGAAEGGFMVMFKIFFSQQLILPAMLLSRSISFYFFVIISAVVTIITHIRTNLIKRKI